MASSKSVTPFPLEVARQETELGALRRMLEISADTCSFSVAVCNAPALRAHLNDALSSSYPGIVVVDLPPRTVDVFAAVNSIVASSPKTALFVTGIEESVPSDAVEQPTLRALNASRELWRKTYQCPIVFWLPEYAATLMSVYARDISSWMSHRFEFVSEFATATMGVQDTFSNDVLTASNLSVIQKRFRIAELEQRIQEAGIPPKSQFTLAVMEWLNELGGIHYVLGDVPLTIHYCELALKIARENGERLQETRVLGNMGVACLALGETHRAIEYTNKSLELAQEIGDRHTQAIALGNLGLAYMRLGEVRRAIDYYQMSLAISVEIGDKRGEELALGNLGVAYADIGDTVRAKEYHERVLAISLEIGDQSARGKALGNLGIAYGILGDVRRAVTYFEQHLAIAREIGDRRGEDAALGNLGVAYGDLGEMRRAVEYYKQQLVLAREIGDRGAEGMALWNMSVEMHRLGQQKQAIAHAEAALASFDQIEDTRAKRVRQTLSKWKLQG